MLEVSLRSRRWIALAATTAVGAALCIGLGANAAEARTTAGASQSLTKVSIQGQKISQWAPVALGKKKGFYKAAGIDLDILYNMTPAQAGPALLAGRIDFSLASWGVLISFASNGIPMRAVANLNVAGKSPKDDDEQLATLAGSSLKSAKNLGGKTIGMIALNGWAEIVVRDAAARAGVAQNQLKFVVVQAADMGTALRAKRIDAAMMTEPYLQLLKTQTKTRELGISAASFIPQVPKLPIMTTVSYQKSHPKIVDAMRKATNRSVAYARKNPKEVAKLLPGLTGQSPKVIAKMKKTHYSEKIDMAKIQRLANAFSRFGKVNKKVNAKDLVF